MKKIIISIILFVTSYHSFSQSYYFEQLLDSIPNPVAFDFLQDNSKIIVTTKTGPVRIYNIPGGLVSTFWNFTDSVYTTGEAGVLGVCKDPEYSINRYIYIYYVKTGRVIRIVRFTENNNIGTNPVQIFEHTGTGDVHFGGNLHFGPLNKLYVSIGDNATANNAQSLTNPFGKILRINTDGSAPTDNPFYDDGNPATGNDDRIWSYGLRNSFDFCFSPINDSLYATENGSTLFDETNFIRKGKNYGWPICEGYCNPYNPLYKQPMSVFANGMIPTGIIIYDGSEMPELFGKMLVASASSNPARGLFKADLNAQGDSVVSQGNLVPQPTLRTLLQNADGFIYALYCCNGGLGRGGILRLRHGTVGINTQNIAVSYSLEQNYPNPFNPVTTIKYSIPKQDFVKIQIFDMLGREISSLVNESKQAGNYEVNWNADNLPSGVYFYRLTAGDYTEEKKMVLLK
jgi:glucose/arabinose dehydrogenase